MLRGGAFKPRTSPYAFQGLGEEGLKLWKEHNTDVGGSFNVNPPLPRVWLAEAKRPDGSFVVDGISTDGGCIPRNVILEQGMAKST